MKRINCRCKQYYFCLFFTAFPMAYIFAQPKTTYPTMEAQSLFRLQNGDRVVFVGNALFENDLEYGYLEYLLTTRWPNVDVTFRNIGWSGDNVWGEARNYFSTPPTPYELLIENLTNARPTHVFVGYGGVEAQEGDAGVGRFTEGLTKLLDKIDELGAKAILLSPTPILSGDSEANLDKRNTQLMQYGSLIAAIAQKRDKAYIDIFTPIKQVSQREPITDNGVHLNQSGYYHLAGIIEKSLGLITKNEVITIDGSRHDFRKTAATAKSATPTETEALRFGIDEQYLPLPLPNESQQQGQVVKIGGLKTGFYTLSSDGFQFVTASAEQWADGVEIRKGASWHQVSELQELIRKKAQLFFAQYRPQNRTYILGMRAYEQGRHAKGLEEISLIIKWLETQIALKRRPEPHVYQLTAL